jgi:carboxyl-terminal processing protease
VAISDLFLPPKKMIVETRGRNERVESRKSSSEKLGLQPNIPIVILINRNSASASEIVAASLQDHGRATIVGERSYGKGTVQNLIPLERNISAIKLTTASYWRPSGRNIDRVSSEQVGSEEWGVSPDPGRLIEMEEEEVFENYRKRHLRDLAGIHQATGFVAKENLGAVQAAEDLKKREPDEPGDNADPLPTTTLPRDEIEQDAENDGPMPDGPAKTGDAEADAKSQEPNELKKYDIDRPMQMAIQIILGSE